MSKLTVAQAIAAAAKGEITVIDVREANELKASGQAKGALHIPLATLVMKANPQGPDFDARQFSDGRFIYKALKYNK